LDQGKSGRLATTGAQNTGADQTQSSTDQLPPGDLHLGPRVKEANLPRVTATRLPPAKLHVRIHGGCDNTGNRRRVTLSSDALDCGEQLPN
jgi:hypothetical protein